MHHSPERKLWKEPWITNFAKLKEMNTWSEVNSQTIPANTGLARDVGTT